MATLSAVTPIENDAARPLPWRRMAWVTWRQHRAALIAVAVFVGVVTLLVWISGLHLHDTYAQALTCRPAGSFACNGAMNSFDAAANYLTNGILLQIVPAVIGVFLGAPLLAREMETGTFRYAWTQGFGRVRWVLAKLVALAVVVAVAASALGALFSWYYQPYFPARNERLGLTVVSPFAPGLFDLRSVAIVGWTLGAFALGAFSGMLVRRVVPAIVASLAAYTGVAFLVSGIVREHYVAPIVTRSLNVLPPSWILGRSWTKGGRPVSQTELGHVLQTGGPEIRGKGGVPQSVASWRYLVHHGFTQVTTYQPTSRFWSFQWIEGGWLLALTLLLLGATVWLVRRSAS